MKRIKDWEQLKKLIDAHVEKYPKKSLQWFFDCHMNSYTALKHAYYKHKPDDYVFPGQWKKPRNSGIKKGQKKRKPTPAATFIEVLESNPEPPTPKPAPKNTPNKDKVAALLEIAQMIRDS